MVLFGILIGIGIFAIERKLLNKGLKGDKLMTETATQKVETPTKSEMLVIGGTSIHNIQHISAKLISIFGYVLETMEPDHGLFGIILNSDNRPVDTDEGPLFARLDPDTKTVAWNLSQHYAGSLDLVMDDASQHSLRGIIWHQMLVTLFHEIHHSKTYDLLELNTSINWDEHEKDAQKWAEEKVIELANLINIEPTGCDNMPYFGELIKSLVELAPEGDEEEGDEVPDLWFIQQMDMLEKSTFWTDLGTVEAGEEKSISTFREWLRTNTDPPLRDDPMWDKEVPDITTLAVVVQEEVKTETVTLDMLFEPDPSITDVISEPDLTLDSFIPEETVVPMTAGGGPSEFPAAPSYSAENTVIPTPISAAVPNFTSPVVVGGAVVNAAEQGGDGAIAPAQQVPLCNLPPEQQTAIAQKVYHRIYEHIFTKCGFNPAAPTSFDNPGAVFDPISISDIPGASEIFLAMDIVDAQGVRQDNIPITGSIRGQIFKKSGLPGYWIWVNANGYKTKRTLVPQNPNTGSPPALRCRNGYAIMWVIADVPGQTKGIFKGSFETVPGQPTRWTPTGN